MSELIIIGAKGGKSGGSSGGGLKEDPDSLRSASYVRVLDLVSEGEIAGLVDGAKSIYFDNVPLQNADGTYNFKDVVWAATAGTQGQAAIAQFTGTESITSSGVEIKKATPVEFVVSDAGVDLVRVAIQVPALSETNTSSGNISGTKVDFKIEVKGSNTAFSQAVSDTISGKTTSGYVREHTINPSAYGAAPWTFRITRLTDDSSSSTLQNKTYLSSYSQINTEKFRYPNSAMVGVSVDAKQFSSIPVRTYDLKLKIVKVPVNYDPVARTYTGSWNGTFKWAWTDNPAWVFYDLVTNTRYGLGEYINESLVDKWGLYEVAKYCDQLVPNGYGGTEPRFTCNLYLQSREDAFKVLQDLASIFRGMVYWMGGSVTVVQDSPKTPIYQFTNGNVVDGLFHRESSDIKSRHNVALVTWNNPANAYQQEVEYVADEELIQQWGFVNQTEIAAFGCTSRGQARRAGRWLLYTERFETNTISFAVGADGAIPYPGCLVQISDANKAGERRGGRLMAASSTTATLDAPVTLATGVAYTLWAVLPDGSMESRQIRGQNELAFSAPFVSSGELASWTNYAGSGELSIAYDALAADGYALQVGNNSGNDQAWLVHGQNIPFDSSKLYRITARVKRLAGSGVVYLGFAGIAADGVTFINANGINAYGSQHYHAALGASPGSSFVTYTGYTKGYGATTGTGGIGTLAFPGKMHPNVRFIRPLILVNYDSLAGITVVDSFTVEAISDYGTGSVVELVSAWSQTPTADSIYVLASADLQPELLRVLSVSEDDQHQYTVTGLEYNASKFDFIETNEPLIIPDVSNLPDASKAPPEPAGITISDTIYVKPGGGIGSKITVSWEKPSGNYGIRGYVLEYRVGADGNWISMAEVPVNDAEILDVVEGEEYGIRIRSVNILGASTVAPAVHLYMPQGKLRPPSDVTGLNFAIDAQRGLELSWQPVADIDIEFYEIRTGASWAAGTVVGRIKATRTYVGFSVGATYYVKALDTTGNYSLSAATIAPTVTAPTAPTVSAQIEAGDLRLSWAEPVGSYNIDSYEISAPGFATRTVKGTTLTVKVDWAGSKAFSVRGLDIGGNYGATGSVTVNVTTPSAPTITQQVIDNNVLLRWSSAKQTLPIDTYEIRRGSTWATATLVGRTLSEFSVIFESSGGSYTYLIAGIDSAGNVGAIGSVAATVSQPPDYVLQLNQNSAFSGTLSNLKLESGALLGPISTTETFDQHFSTRSWASPQAQINAGYPLYIQPSVTSGYYEEVVDYGTVLAGTKVTVTPDVQTIAGNPTWRVDISVRKLVTDAWTDYANTTSVYGTDFRYIKFRVTLLTDTGDDLAQINSINLRLDTKLKNDGGRIYANAADVGGTVVSFGIPFVDIQSITVTPEGTAPVTCTYDFTDVPNPTQFKVLLFNTSGTRVSGWVSWAAKGA